MCLKHRTPALACFRIILIYKIIDQRITIKYILSGIFCVVITWLVHEYAHWVTCNLLGYEATMNLNGTSVLKGEHPTILHKNIISASGPLVTITQGLVVFLFLKIKNWNKYLYLFLFTAFYMRFLAGLMNFINPNDEGRISEYLGLGMFTIPIIVSGFLFLLVHIISRKYTLNLKFHIWTIVVIMAASSILILSDQFFGIRII